MKTIGLIGGISWNSTALYYQIINESVQQRLGGIHSAKICICSVDLGEIAPLQHSNDWDGIAKILGKAAQSVEASGADFLLIGANTIHKIVDQISSYISIPILHIVDATALALKERNITKVGLLGTKFTMSGDFYRERLAEHGIDTVIPTDEGQKVVHDVIYNELCQGEIKEESRQAYSKVIEQLRDNGAQGVILGCTEIPLLIEQEHSCIPIFNTTSIHAIAAVETALKP